jgi:hypothetical protein
MTLVAVYSLKTRQLDAINAFLNAHNDEHVYCQMLDDYKLSERYYKIIETFYDQQKSSLL